MDEKLDLIKGGSIFTRRCVQPFQRMWSCQYRITAVGLLASPVRLHSFGTT